MSLKYKNSQGEWVQIPIPSDNKKLNKPEIDGTDGQILGIENGETKWIDQSGGGLNKYTVEELPTENIDENGIYFLPKEKLNVITLPSFSGLKTPDGSDYHKVLIHDKGNDIYYVYVANFYYDNANYYTSNGGYFTFRLPNYGNQTRLFKLENNQWTQIAEQYGRANCSIQITSQGIDFLYVNQQTRITKDYDTSYEEFIEVDDNTYNIDGEYIGSDLPVQEYAECIRNNGKWERIGYTDLSNYTTQKWVEDKHYLISDDIKNKQDNVQVVRFK